MTSPSSPSRRQLLRGALAAGGALIAPGIRPRRALAQAAARPALPFGVQAGEVTADRAVVWSATDRPARLIVEYAATESFQNARRVVGPAALPETGHTAKVVLTGLPAGQDVFYRATFLDLGDMKTTSEPVVGRFRTAPVDGRDVTFVWSGDTVGQGWGINQAWGGLRLYEVMRGLEPDFFVNSGDMIYADGPLKADVDLPGGGTWKNLVTEAKSKVAETLEEYRGNYRYNLMDEHMRRFNAQVAQYVQWDDHEVTNNWFHERILEDDRYTVKNVALLAARAKRAMFEFTTLAGSPVESDRVYRRIRRGPNLDLFMIDMRSYRGPNAENRETSLERRRADPGPGADHLAEAGAPRVPGHLEGDRRRHAARAGRLPRRRQEVGVGGRRPGQRPRARPRARDRRPPPLHQAQRDPERRLDHRRRPLLRDAPLRARRARSSPTSRPSTSSSPARSTPADSARTSSTTPSVRAWSSRRTPRAASTRRRPRGVSTSVTSGSTARAA